MKRFHLKDGRGLSTLAVHGKFCTAILAFICSSAISPAIVDTNNDGLSDLWEQQYNNGQLFDPPLDPTADSDGDGWTNSQESTANTNPLNCNPPDGILRPDVINIPAVWGAPDENGNPVPITPDTIRVSWQTVSGKQYTLLYSPDLTAWLPVDGAYIGNGTITEYNFPLADPTKTFWRVKIEDVDSDGDALTDAEEYVFATDPANPTTISGIPDLWLAENFASVLMTSGYSAIDPNADPDSDGINTVEELQSGTNPNSADAAGLRQWVTVHGNGEALEKITRTGTLTIPAGQSAILVVAIASEEFPNYTGDQSEFNDLMEWHATPSQGTSIDGFINVNERHFEWEMDVVDGTKLPGLPSPVHIEQVRGLTAPPDSDLTIQVEVSATNISDGQLPSFVTVGLIPMEITWKAISGFDNVDDHIDPWTNQTNGMRIFPDFKNPGDTELRDKLELVVKTSSALIGKTIFVNAFDVDDSTDETFDSEDSSPVIDINGKNGGDNLTDYKNTPQNGQFWDGSAWGGYTSNGLVDANGETKFVFGVGMQPGSNYRVVASLIDETMYAGVQNSDPTSQKYLGPEINQNGGTAASPLLTVWRRLWVENDSMEAIPVDQYGYKRNDLSRDLYPPVIRNRSYSTTTGNTSFVIDMITDQSSFSDLQNGQIIVQSNSHTVIGTDADQGQNSTGYYSLTVSGDYSNVPVNSEFRLYDDDDFGLNRPPLPRNDLIDDTFKSLFRPAFIEVVDAANFKGQDYNPSKTVEFHRNHPVMIGPWGNQSPGVWDDAINLTDTKSLWVGNLIAGYQGEVGDDRDPSSENFIEGITPGSRNYSVVYVEVIRDKLDGVLRSPHANITTLNNELGKNLKLTGAHEIAHMPGGGNEASHHGEMGLMEGYGNGEEYFMPQTVLRFRNTEKWQQP